MNIPMLDLTLQYRSIKSDILKALEGVLESSHYILGPQVTAIEESIAAFSNVEHGIGVANGSDALHISLMACGVEPGDEVITSSFTFFATAGAIARLGATPVFVDIEPETFNINPKLIEAKITPRTKAIIPVHLYGQTADMDPIIAIARKHGLMIVEDAAQAIGAEYKGRRTGQLGDACCYSFFPTKNLGAYGDAGMIVTDNSDLNEKMRVIRVHGSKPKYYHHVLGYNSRLDEMQAAILNVKFAYLEEWSRLRREKARNYTELLSERLPTQVKTPFEAEDRRHIYHQYTISVKRRDELQSFLQGHGISTMIYYPRPLHLQPVFSYLEYEEGHLPHTENAAKHVLSLPMYPELTIDQQSDVVNKIVAFYNNESGE